MESIASTVSSDNDRQVRAQSRVRFLADNHMLLTSRRPSQSEAPPNSSKLAPRLCRFSSHLADVGNLQNARAVAALKEESWASISSRSMPESRNRDNRAVPTISAVQADFTLPIASPSCHMTLTTKLRFVVNLGA